MRAIWSGFISFGLVNIPVKLYSAVNASGLDFDMLHESDMSPIRYAKFCKAEEKEIPFEQIVKGYEYEKGHYVVMTDEDFLKANVGVSKAITILDFVKAEEIDQIFFEKPYYLEAQSGGEKPYVLLREALRRSEKVGIGKYVLRNREHLVSLQVEGNYLILEQLRFREEIREVTELTAPQNIEINNDEIEIALSLIDKLTQKFTPEVYRDTYSGELRRVIEEKIEGKIPAAKGQVPQPTPVPDLVAILKKSLEEERKKTKA